jgi:hypothetical protein
LPVHAVATEGWEPSDGLTAEWWPSLSDWPGFAVNRVEQVAAPVTYLDIGAVVFQLLAVPWRVPGFTVERFDADLRAMDRRIRTEGGFTMHDHRILVAAVNSLPLVRPGRSAPVVSMECADDGRRLGWWVWLRWSQTPGMVTQRERTSRAAYTTSGGTIDSGARLTR